MAREAESKQRYAEVAGSPGAGARTAGLVRLAGPLLAGAAAVGYLLRAALPYPHVSTPAAGVLLVGLSALLAIHLVRGRRRLDRFLKGALGEESVARVLAFLPAPFRVFHGVRIPGDGGAGGDVECDHVVVGPTGIFAVETKNWSGRVTVRDGKVLYDGWEPSRPPLDQVRTAAHALRAALTHAGIEGAAVLPVLVFASDTLEPAQTGAEGVIVCRRSRLAAALSDTTELPLSPGAQATAADFLARCVGP